MRASGAHGYTQMATHSVRRAARTSAPCIAFACLSFGVAGCAGMRSTVPAAPAAEPARPSPEFLDRRTWGERGPPFSEAVRHGDTLYLSGQIGTKPGTMQLVPGGLGPEARQTLTNVRDVLRAYGLDLGDVVKCTVMLADMKEWPAFNDVYREFFQPPYPARSALGASGLALGARVEVECIAAIRK